MATSPVVMMLLAWALLSERPRVPHLAGAGIGIAGVCLMLFTGVAAVGALGVLASIAAMVMSSFGYVLAKRWSEEADVLSSTSWQLIAGGVVLVPFAVVVEGAPPALEGPATLGFAYVAVVATALAFAAWFTGLRHLPAGTVGLVGLLNPVTGVLLGTTVAGEALTARQLCGLALVLLGILLGQPGAARLTALVRSRAGRSPSPAGAAPAMAVSAAGPSPPRSSTTTTCPERVSGRKTATGTANTPGREVIHRGRRAGRATPTDRSRDAGSR